MRPTGESTDIAALLRPGAAGGVVSVSDQIDVSILEAAGARAGARVVDLRHVDSKQALLDALKSGLGLPEWFGNNWDALEETLAFPEPDQAGPVLIIWPQPASLETLDAPAARTFRSIVRSAASSRHARAAGPLLLIEPQPLDQKEQTFDTFLVWRIDWTAGFDCAWLSIGPAALKARGLIAAQHPARYTASYDLETDAEYVTTSLALHVTTADGNRGLELRRDEAGWSVNGRARPDLAGALDCDISACPLTNTMPILRHDLHRQPGEVTLTMAFVRLPELDVVPSLQTYTHLGVLDDGRALVRYSSGDFEADLTVSVQGIVETYPKLGAHLESTE